jgi:hypothetical protein
MAAMGGHTRQKDWRVLQHLGDGKEQIALRHDSGAPVTAVDLNPGPERHAVGAGEVRHRLCDLEAVEKEAEAGD